VKNSPKSMTKKSRATSRKSLSLKPIKKVPTGIFGFDEIAHGGLPEGRTTLVAGTTGSGKTIFATAFLYHGMDALNESAVFVTFEEKPEDIMRNMLDFGWDLQKYKAKNMLYFVDVSTQPEMAEEVGAYDLSGLITRVVYGVKKVNAKRVVIDTLSALLDRLQDKVAIRAGLFQLASELKAIGVTTILTAEHEEKLLGTVTATFMEYVSDNVVVLHSFLQNEFRKRTIEILKFRGTGYDSSATPLVINGDGIFIYPRPHAVSPETASLKKVHTGISGLDEMANGGFHEFSTTLISGASGVGKTIMAMHFILEGAKRGQKGLYIAFEESTTQLLRNADAFGWPMRKYLKSGTIEIISKPPEERPAEEYFKYVKDIVTERNVKRFVLDSLSGIERVYAPDKFLEFVIGLNSFLKGAKVTSYFTNTIGMLLGGAVISESHLSTLTDNIVLLKYVEIEGEMKRAINLLKTRGSQHDKRLHEFLVSEHGIVVGDAFVGFSGLMEGTAVRVVRPPVDVTEQMVKIDMLRKKFLDKKISVKAYHSGMEKIKKEIQEVQRKGF
jgi:circadian clock protein KaiC